ncbi:MAG: DUF177 domain-containing protein [Roseovarius sp.]
MSEEADGPWQMAVAGLSPRKTHEVDIRPGAGFMARLAESLGLLGLRKLRLTGTLSAEGRADWRFEGTLGATVTQRCVVTLEPVVTRIDEPVVRRYLAEWPPVEETAGEEVEMPEDESIDPLPDAIDLGAVMEEALALALPPYPRAAGAELEEGEGRAAPPGETPLRDDDLKPFAGLADLKKKLEGGGED